MTGMHSDHTDKHHTYWKVALGKLFSTSEMPIATVITASYANTMYSGNSSFFTSSGLPHTAFASSCTSGCAFKYFYALLPHAKNHVDFRHHPIQITHEGTDAHHSVHRVSDRFAIFLFQPRVGQHRVPVGAQIDPALARHALRAGGIEEGGGLHRVGEPTVKRDE